MERVTHQLIDAALCGDVLELAEGTARVALDTRRDMIVDASGLVHGGFVFGLADHAAMLAVNHPHVVLGAAEVRFTAPVREGDRVVATAEVLAIDGRKRRVRAEAHVGSQRVLEGTFTCLVLDAHVLA